MEDVIELHELDSSLVHHFASEGNLIGLKEIISQRPQEIDKCNEVMNILLGFLHIVC